MKWIEARGVGLDSDKSYLVGKLQLGVKSTVYLSSLYSKKKYAIFLAVIINLSHKLTCPSVHISMKRIFFKSGRNQTRKLLFKPITIFCFLFLLLTIYRCWQLQLFSVAAIDNIFFLYQLDSSLAYAPCQFTLVPSTFFKRKFYCWNEAMRTDKRGEMYHLYHTLSMVLCCFFLSFLFISFIHRAIPLHVRINRFRI